MWHTNIRSDSHLMLEANENQTMLSHGCLLICYSLHPLFSIFVMAICVLLLLLTHHMLRPNFVSENLFCLQISGYVALGTHHLLSPFLAFSNYLLFPLLGHQPVPLNFSSLQGETRHLRDDEVMGEPFQRVFNNKSINFFRVRDCLFVYCM